MSEKEQKIKEPIRGFSLHAALSRKKGKVTVKAIRPRTTKSPRKAKPKGKKVPRKTPIKLLEKGLSRGRYSCKICGAKFNTLGAVNAHYRIAGHAKTVKTKLRRELRTAGVSSKEDAELVGAIYKLIREPDKMKDLIREALTKKK